MKKTSIWQRLGPGILLAATSIGASHLVLSPQVGALYGFELLWLVLVAHLFKYPAFEFGPRYAAATGKSLLAGYAAVPGPKNWPVYLFMVSTVLQGVGVLAGVVGISGCVLATWIGDPEATVLLGLTATEAFSLAVLIVVIVLLFAGGFRVLDHLNKVMMGILTLATILAFVPVFPDPVEFRHFVIPTIPDGSIVLIAAVLGWMPTGIDVSVWHSFWTLEKLKLLGVGNDDSPMSRTDRLKLALTDMRLGYGLSFVTGVMFVTIGAAHLTGMGAELKGVQFAEAMSTAYTAIFGRWMYHVFMMTAFFAMFSTSYAVVDGFSRAFSESMAIIKTGTATEQGRKKTYGGFVLGSGICAAVTLVFVGNPVTVVLIVALISLTIAPVLYALNLYCVNSHIEDPAQRPAKVTTVIGWMGTVFMVVALAVTIYVKLIA